MIVKVLFDSVSKAADEFSSLTVREWETLARLYGELEFSGVGVVYSPDDTKLTANGMENSKLLGFFATLVEASIRGHLVGFGMESAEWFVWVSPVMSSFVGKEYDTLLSDVPWNVNVRLRPRVSARSSGAPEALHKPTLSEQHEKRGRQ